MARQGLGWGAKSGPSAMCPTCLPVWHQMASANRGRWRTAGPLTRRTRSCIVAATCSIFAGSGDGQSGGGELEIPAGECGEKCSGLGTLVKLWVLQVPPNYCQLGLQAPLPLLSFLLVRASTSPGDLGLSGAHYSLISLVLPHQSPRTRHMDQQHDLGSCSNGGCSVPV